MQSWWWCDDLQSAMDCCIWKHPFEIAWEKKKRFLPWHAKCFLLLDRLLVLSSCCCSNILLSFYSFRKILYKMYTTHTYLWRAWLWIWLHLDTSIKWLSSSCIFFLAHYTHTHTVSLSLSPHSGVSCFVSLGDGSSIKAVLKKCSAFDLETNPALLLLLLLCSYIHTDFNFSNPLLL